MSINHPKQKQIKLPFKTQRPGTSRAEKRVCGICRKRDSQYTCPRCNVAYCSLDCFRDQSHVQCSEPFYKSTVLDEIASDPKADMEEKKRMMEMLKRFEDAQADGEGFISELDDEEEEEDELEKALKGLDIDNLDSNKLFHLLPQHHRDAFLHVIRNPESEEAKELLDMAVGDEEAEEDSPDVLPWWEGDNLDQEDDISAASTPQMIDEKSLAEIVPPSGIGLRLCYNAIAIAISYIHILLSSRLPSLDPEYLSSPRGEIAEDVKGLFANLVPFLVDPRSTVRYESIRETWSAVWEQIGLQTTSPPSPEMLVRLLGILPTLLQPPILADSHPKIVHLLSDMYTLFSKPKAGGAVPRKLAFYVVALKQLDREDWLRLKKEVEKEIGRLESENGVEQVLQETERPALML